MTPILEARKEVFDRPLKAKNPKRFYNIIYME